ncbi:hypothetical protein BJY00DRAFT_314180 [Aspergillus carlsbadensis]|nr:hypothetical protein BJY00DRAFT_314180 [Aspergillus carlsbadensis]
MLACAARVPRVSPLNRGISARFASTWLLGPELRSDSGVTYKLDESSVDRHGTDLPVYESSADGRQYSVQVIPRKEDFENYLWLQSRVSWSPFVRTATDTIREHQALVYPGTVPMNLGTKKPRLPFVGKRRVLRGALLGLEHLHARGIVHDSKLTFHLPISTAAPPVNLVPQAIVYEETEDQKHNGKIMISLDSIALLPGEWLTGPGTDFSEPHRSPEAWCAARRNQASDIFSFGTLIIYAMAADTARKLPFHVDPGRRSSYKSRWRRTMSRQVAMCGGKESFCGFLEHIGRDSPFRRHLFPMMNASSAEYSRFPITSGDRLALPPDVADLVAKMTDLDPARRITAREALNHKYFMYQAPDSDLSGATTDETTTLPPE